MTLLAGNGMLTSNLDLSTFPCACLSQGGQWEGEGPGARVLLAHRPRAISVT